MNISFRMTAYELVYGLKSCTRRRWKASTAAHFKAGTVHVGWSNLPRVSGARRLARIRATQDAYLERLGDLPLADLKAEGGMCETVEEFIRLIEGDPDEQLYVARFEIVEVLSFKVHWRWKVGDIALLACYGGPQPAQIIEVRDKYIDCLDTLGMLNTYAPEELHTVEQYIQHADLMRDDWTGKQYLENIERARAPFVPPEWWDEAVKLAMLPFWWTEQDTADCEAFNIGERLDLYACRRCEFWQSADGEKGECKGPEVQCGLTSRNSGCEQFWPRVGKPD